MRDITLDLTPFEEKISLHRYLKETLDFPFYYGANLDALRSMPITTPMGSIIPLSTVAHVDIELAPQTIVRSNQNRQITVTGNAITGTTTQISQQVQAILDAYTLRIDAKAEFRFP